MHRQEYSSRIKRITVRWVWAIMLAAVASGWSQPGSIQFNSRQGMLLDGKPFFPIMVWLMPAESLDLCAGLGINTFGGVWEQTTEKARTYLDECRKRGVRGIIEYDDSLKNHPALLAWIHTDEPDMPNNKKEPRVPQAQTLEYYQKVKAGDREHPVFMNLTANFNTGAHKQYQDNGFYRAYRDMTDFIGYDDYVIYGWMAVDSLNWVADDAIILRNLTDDKLPIYAWIETSGGSRWLTPAKQRHPHPYEIRAEVYMAVIHGARAIAYFTHTWVGQDKIGNPGYTTKGGIEGDYSVFGVPPENRAELKKTNGQLTRLAPVLASPDLTGLVTKEEQQKGRVDMLVKKADAFIYIFSVNAKRATERVSFTVKGLKKGAQIEVLDEDRTLTSRKDGFEDDFTEYAVHIYRFRFNK